MNETRSGSLVGRSGFGQRPVPRWDRTGAVGVVATVMDGQERQTPDATRSASGARRPGMAAEGSDDTGICPVLDVTPPFEHVSERTPLRVPSTPRFATR